MSARYGRAIEFLAIIIVMMIVGYASYEAGKNSPCEEETIEIHPINPGQ